MTKKKNSRKRTRSQSIAEDRIAVDDDDDIGGAIGGAMVTATTSSPPTKRRNNGKSIKPLHVNDRDEAEEECSTAVSISSSTASTVSTLKTPSPPPTAASAPAAASDAGNEMQRVIRQVFDEMKAQDSDRLMYHDHDDDNEHEKEDSPDFASIERKINHGEYADFKQDFVVCCNANK